MFRSPSQAGLPHLHYMVDDLPANRKQIARHLDIAPRTLDKYIAAGQAPRAVMLALFWETRWGRGAADCEAANYAAMHAGRANALERENAELRRQIEALEAMVSQGDPASNVPFFRPGQPARGRISASGNRAMALRVEPKVSIRWRELTIPFATSRQPYSEPATRL